jgi:predicted polyphosphate/ATP-dependent NAD kinase
MVRLSLGPGPLRVGVIVNPAAGMGGRLGLKGTDGRAFLEALARGAKPVSHSRASRFLWALKPSWIKELLIPPGIMGAGAPGYPWRLSGRVRIVDCVDPWRWPTSRADTVECARSMADSVDLLVFVGGDGTARDVMDSVDMEVAVLGVPAGVKVYSPVFARSPEAAAVVVGRCSESECSLEEREVLDIDEEAFRRGELRVRRYGYLLVPRAPEAIQGGKEPSRAGVEVLDDIAEQVAEDVEECTLYILGPGTTVARVAARLGVEKTLLGVDAYHNGRLVGRDLDAESLEEIASHYKRVKLILSPIGGTGFLLGRGNQQIPPSVIRRAGREGLIVVSDPEKLRSLNYTLLVDTGDRSVDEELEGPVRVVVGYNRWAVAFIKPAWKVAREKHT